MLLTLIITSIVLFTQEAFVACGVSEGCVRCVCLALSDCNLDRGCEGDICGPLLITRNYWLDCGRPTLPGDNPFGPRAYQNCANNYKCAKRAFQKYMARYKRDCNGDGKIDCRDYASIHKYGPGGCVGKTDFGDLVQQCLNTKANSSPY